jgi:hypothetical protein
MGTVITSTYMTSGGLYYLHRQTDAVSFHIIYWQSYKQKEHCHSQYLNDRDSNHVGGRFSYLVKDITHSCVMLVSFVATTSDAKVSPGVNDRLLQ